MYSYLLSLALFSASWPLATATRHPSPRKCGGSRQSNQSTVSTVFQLKEKGTWFENLALTQAGIIIATRLDVPELWRINPSTGHGTNLVSVPGVTSLLGITPVGSGHDYVVIGGNVTTAAVTTNGSYGAYMVTLSDSAATTAKVTKSITGPVASSQLWNGNTPFGKDIVLVSDSFAGAVYAVDYSTGENQVALRDDTMSAAGGSSTVGINGIKMYDGYLYYTNMAKGTLHRVKLAANKPSMAGPIETVATGVYSDDFWITNDGTLYLTSTSNTIYKVDAKTKEKTVIAGGLNSLDVPGNTACQVGVGKYSDTVFVTVKGELNGTFVEPAKITAVKLSWSN